MDTSDLDLPIAFTIATVENQTNSSSQDAEMQVMINRDGINLILKSSAVSATSETIPWNVLIQDILNKIPDLLGDLTDPYHLGFKQALEELGFSPGSR